MVRTPPAELQAHFVTSLQRLLTEGRTENTYKFALLIALARWSLENPDYDESQPIDVRQLVPHILELYWPHAHPFGAASTAAAEARPPYGSATLGQWRDVLVQDRGQKNEHQVPRVLKEIRAALHAGATSLPQLAEDRRTQLLRQVRRSIAEMPLWKLQTVRSSTEPVHFLYRQAATKYELRFEPGVVACLVHFAPLIEETVRAAWLRFVLRCNPHLLGAVAQVEDFLFPDSRPALGVWRAPLQELQDDACFYCGKRIGGTPAIDHFLPWARYRRDLGHNFVLAHAECNGRKSDHLASCDHLERWCQRNEAHGRELGVRFDELRLPHDWPTLRRVAGSLYQLAESVDSRVWLRDSKLVPLDPKWRALLGAA